MNFLFIVYAKFDKREKTYIKDVKQTLNYQFPIILQLHNHYNNITTYIGVTDQVTIIKIKLLV